MGNPAEAPGEAIEGLKLEKISNNVYAETGFRGCNPGFVVTREGVVMIDTPQMPADALGWRDVIAKHGTVRYLINTEPHGDHFTGNCFFKGTVVAHEGTRAAIMAATANVEQVKERLAQASPELSSQLKGFSYRLPTITLSERMTLYVGDHTFQLINMPGHTPYQVAVFIPEERVVFTSDNIFCRVQAFLQQALPYEWLESLKQLEELEADVLIPGHGSVCDRSYIPEMRSVIQSWIDAVTQAIEEGLTVEEAQDKITDIDPYPVEGGIEAMSRQLPRINVARLYQVLKE
jgi:glyoxylase-like metal-dependent hydrolase (beta-lactamase superfamily II)